MFRTVATYATEAQALRYAHRHLTGLVRIKQIDRHCWKVMQRAPYRGSRSRRLAALYGI